MSEREEPSLLPAEWACLGIVGREPTHGFAVASRLKPTGDIGRVWSVSRALTYRALHQLTAYGYIEVVGSEPGVAGGARTIVAITADGRVRLDDWLATPVDHLRDFRTALLLKLVLSQDGGRDPRPLLQRQRDHVARLAVALTDAAKPTDEPAGGPATIEAADVVALWRSETAQSTLRFLDRLLAMAGNTADETLAPGPGSATAGTAAEPRRATAGRRPT